MAIFGVMIPMHPCLIPLQEHGETGTANIGLVQQNPEAQFATLTVQDEVAFGMEDTKRFDILTKLSAGLWSPLILGTRFGIGYEYSIRNSSADSESDNYNYTEQRALLKARWVFDINPWAPGVVEPQGHVALDYGLGGDSGGGLDQERIQDLLRQDEAARRGSSCID